MALFDTVTLRCDRCHAEARGDIGEAPSDLRARLRRDAWEMSLDRADYEDRCPNCADRR